MLYKTTFLKVFIAAFLLIATTIFIVNRSGWNSPDSFSVTPTHLTRGASQTTGNFSSRQDEEPGKTDTEQQEQSQTRTQTISYTVSSGDTIFSIADRYGLQPETILWSNVDLLGNNPHMLVEGQVLRIPPEDGLIYEWQSGDRLPEVARQFGVAPEEILKYPENTNGDDTVTIETFQPEPGQSIFIPHGRRDIAEWGYPAPVVTNRGPSP